ncbi:hypothetical protein DL93DRAFT_2076663 [Clavulina sp. PMI_390]|nr:hypothetical protein DL93DRAFT_2076663 [Clavulina sp. PMI_390]
MSYPQQPGGAPYGAYGGYQPTQFQPAMNAGFWGVLIDQQWMPSELFSRLADSIFFYLDANAQCAYNNTGYIEPDKYMWWSTYVQTVQQEKAVSDWVAQNAMAGLYDAGSVPYTIVTVPNGKQMPILDRQGFLHSMISSARVDPQIFLQKLNKSIPTFNLIDPLTNQPFPGFIPASAIPQMKDWAASSRFTTWQMTVGSQYRTAAMQKQLQSAQRKRMIGGAFHMLTGGLSGGFGGGGSTGFGF